MRGWQLRSGLVRVDVGWGRWMRVAATGGRAGAERGRRGTYGRVQGRWAPSAAFFVVFASTLPCWVVEGGDLVVFASTWHVVRLGRLERVGVASRGRGSGRPATRAGWSPAAGD